jgi:hypothetical protein
MGATIRVSEATRDRLARLARALGRPMTQLLDDAADALERQLFFDELAARWDELRADEAEWQATRVEREVESVALRDSST